MRLSRKTEALVRKTDQQWGQYYRAYTGVEMDCPFDISIMNGMHKEIC